ncbi:hypothetical protein Ae201684P_002648 [Aphanomyces euteiches]|uniref:Thioredoxin-like fold domain-containing protein n=1 Tax=Aphanomyces euteiches TaxID=100861 RepID=A0A6G0X5K6_9STRA|nr:hypothetical protein Ae201684_008408 [Aphanomyces euteiches]KAH9070286.1 hypothetical protein Ae201684P_002648 [Aphanomyces euteiches]KAH9152342.1 hypothetical protein AeRB84_005206 [Aphanomyces euteiches]
MFMYAVLIVLPFVAMAQVPVPPTPPGFTIGHGSASANVQLEVFVDLLCPYSKMAYPALKQLVQHESPDRFRLRVHQFPLPYHHQAFSVAQASETISFALGRETFETWMEAVFEEQDSFGNKVTENQGQKNVTAQIHALAKKTFPNLTDAQWADGMTGHGGTDRDDDTRVAWKYACSRGISGTPMFLLNAVAIDADPAWTYHDWIEFLKPFLDPPSDTNPRHASIQLDAAATFVPGISLLSGLVVVVGCVAVAMSWRFRFRRGYRRLL